MSWLAKLISRISSNSASPMTSPEASMTGDESRTTSPPEAKPSAVSLRPALAPIPPEPLQPQPVGKTIEDQLIQGVLLRSGLSLARDEDVAFYRRAHDAGKLNYRDVRKIGATLSADEKKAVGITYRGSLTREFLDTLNEHGLSDPEMAAQMIAQPAANLIASAKSIRAARMAGIDKFKLRPSNMAAGPCACARAVTKKALPVKDVEPVPFPDCSHPDQCACRWQSVY